MDPHRLPAPCPPPPPPDGERGFILLIALVATVVPLLLLLGASSQTMRSRYSRLDAEVHDERALVAAESGIDLAVYQASTAAGLTSGVPFTRDLGNGMTVAVTPLFLGNDLDDNDGDTLLDAADPDENVFRVLASGRSGNRVRRLVAYLGPQPSFDPLLAALTLLDPLPGQELHLQGSSNLHGNDTDMDGSPGNPANDTFGAMIAAPFTVAQLLANLPGADQAHVLGIGGTPSLGDGAATIDMAALQLKIQNAADVVLTSNSYNNKQFGDGHANDFHIAYRNGNVEFKGHTHGAGILFVNGNLHTQGRFEFEGIIFVTGDVELHGNVGSGVYGGIVVGAASPHVYLEGNMEVWYSAQAIAGATATLPGKYLAFNGWQEISRQ